MTNSSRFTIALLATLGLLFGVVGLLHASALSLTDRIVAVQPSLASKTDEPVDAGELARAIASVPKVNRDWAALMLAVAAHESALSDRIRRGECRPKECDGGRAWSLWQQHRNKLNATSWGSTDLAVQTAEAARALRRAFYQCNGGGASARRGLGSAHDQRLRRPQLRRHLARPRVSARHVQKGEG